MLEQMLLNQLSDKLGKKIEAEKLNFNQFTGDIELENLVVYKDREGTEVMLTLERGRAKVNVGDLLMKKVNIAFASVDNLSVVKKS